MTWEFLRTRYDLPRGKMIVVPVDLPGNQPVPPYPKDKLTKSPKAVPKTNQPALLYRLNKTFKKEKAASITRRPVSLYQQVEKSEEKLPFTACNLSTCISVPSSNLSQCVPSFSNTLSITPPALVGPLSSYNIAAFSFFSKSSIISG